MCVVRREDPYIKLFISLRELKWVIIYALPLFSTALSASLWSTIQPSSQQRLLRRFCVNGHVRRACRPLALVLPQEPYTYWEVTRLQRGMLAKSWKYSATAARIMLAKSSYMSYTLARGILIHFVVLMEPQNSEICAFFVLASGHTCTCKYNKIHEYPHTKVSWGLPGSTLGTALGFEPRSRTSDCKIPTTQLTRSRCGSSAISRVKSSELQLPVPKGGLTPLHGYFPLSNPQDEMIVADWPKLKKGLIIFTLYKF